MRCCIIFPAVHTDRNFILSDNFHAKILWSIFWNRKLGFEFLYLIKKAAILPTISSSRFDKSRGNNMKKTLLYRFGNPAFPNFCIDHANPSCFDTFSFQRILKIRMVTKILPKSLWATKTFENSYQRVWMSKVSMHLVSFLSGHI